MDEIKSSSDSEGGEDTPPPAPPVKETEIKPEEE